MTGRSMPSFVIVGAQRCGTTSLYRWLSRHPEIYLSSIKEPNFFVHDLFGRNGIGDVEAVPDISMEKVAEIIKKSEFRITGFVSHLDVYQALFEPGKTKKARGEASVSYLYFATETAKRIYQTIPEGRIIIVLRDPIERAWSAYKFFLGREYLSPKDAFLAGKSRVLEGWEPFWDYLGLGLYAQQVKAFLDVFPREQIGIWLYEDLMKDKQQYYREILRFIGVSENFVPDFSKENASKERLSLVKLRLERMPLVRNLKKAMPQAFRALISHWIDKMFGKELRLDPELRAWLLEFYRGDILELHKLLPELNALRWIETQERKIEECYRTKER